MISNLAKTSFNMATSASGDIVEEVSVKATIFAQRMLQ